MKDNFDVHRKRAALPLVLALVLMAMGPVAASAEDPPPKFAGGGMSMVQYLTKKGEDRKAVFGARALARYDLGKKLHLSGRADASATQDGGSAAAPSVSFTDLNSFTALEVYGALGYEIAPGIEITGVYGLAIEMDAGKPKILERYPQTIAFGVAKRFSYGGETGFVLATIGRHDAAGGSRYDKLIFTAQIPLKGGVYGVGDAVVNLGNRGASFSRTGLAYRF